MRRALGFALILSVAVPLCAGNRNGYHHDRSISISTDDWQPVTRCDQIQVRNDDERVPMIEQEIPVGNIRTLRVRPPQNGGVRVVGTDDRNYSIKACKAAFYGQRANDISVGFSGDELSAKIPDDIDAVVFFLVRAPRNASLDLEARNGEIGIQDVSGTVKVSTTNGPISLKNVSGSVDADAINGPISFSGGAGDIKLNAQNGPISIKLDGTTWTTGSLEAHTQNGPMSLKLPSGYRSGVVVESDGHGPMSCRAEACRSAKRTWDDDDTDSRRIELGSGPTVVRLSTRNGPVSVRERD